MPKCMLLVPALMAPQIGWGDLGDKAPHRSMSRPLYIKPQRVRVRVLVRVRERVRVKVRVRVRVRVGENTGCCHQ